MEKTCAEPGPKLAVSRPGSRPTHSAKAMHRSRGAPVNSSCSRTEGAVVPMATGTVGIISSLKPLGTTTRGASGGSSWPQGPVGWMASQAKPMKLRSNRSLRAETCTVRPKGSRQPVFSRSSANVKPTLLSGGRRKQRPGSMWIALLFEDASSYCALGFSHIRASRRSECWSRWFSSAAISRRDTTARCMLTKTLLRRPMYLPTERKILQRA
mmetsp:Transcript_49157/g.157175  ORF Transcript_49157/g.157175 Transcript_49157/m.157175 type:complete len:212 (-) Transcript_49157:386-1021(-)